MKEEGLMVVWIDVISLCIIESPILLLCTWNHKSDPRRVLFIFHIYIYIYIYIYCYQTSISKKNAHRKNRSNKHATLELNNQDSGKYYHEQTRHTSDRSTSCTSDTASKSLPL